MTSSKKKTLASRLLIAGLAIFGAAVLILIIGLIVGAATDGGIPWKDAAIGGKEWNDFGLALGMWAYWQSLAVDLVTGQVYWPADETFSRMLIFFLTVAVIVVSLILVIVSAKEKKHVGVCSGISEIIVFVLFGMVYMTIIYGLEQKLIYRQCFDYLCIVGGLDLAALALLFFSSIVSVLERETVYVAAPVEEKKEEPVEEKKEEPVEEKKEEPKEEKPAPAVVPAPAPVAATGIPTSSKRRHSSFETKVKNSDEDLRHKYYDLRDYIKSYGVNNRISIPGDTFSAHRERYVFITISGKHMKVSYALNPRNYNGSTIPVEENTAKKFDDLPLSFKVRSDLSYRRALQLVDDVMARKGVKKPEAKPEEKK